MDVLRMLVSLAEKKVTGPASYFPSIEKKYGKRRATDWRILIL